MLLSWERLMAYYGADELAIHRWRFEQAGETTHGMLCCRWSPDGDRVRASSGEHCEVRLLQTDLWTQHIPGAVRAWTPANQPIVTAMVLNRTPCADCTNRLVEALEALQKQYPVACENNRFLLVCRGKYWGRGPGVMTLIPHLRRLREAGWELCVLQMGSDLPPSGRELAEDLRHHRLAFLTPVTL
jgi:hypothetical protein